MAIKRLSKTWLRRIGDKILARKFLLATLIACILLAWTLFSILFPGALVQTTPVSLWSTYSNKEFGISFRYPPSFRVINFYESSYESRSAFPYVISITNAAEGKYPITGIAIIKNPDSQLIGQLFPTESKGDKFQEEQIVIESNLFRHLWTPRTDKDPWLQYHYYSSDDGKRDYLVDIRTNQKKEGWEIADSVLNSLQFGP